MKKLSIADQQRIAAFLNGDQVRPLEKSLYRYHFTGGTQAEILAELARFQNADGGFGHGLEPDLRLPDSSVIATSVAFQRLRETAAPADHPLIVNGCRYLRDTYDPVAGKWAIIPPNVDDAPHAPWWVYGEALSHSLLNPSAEILGYLYEYGDHFPAQWRQQATDAIVTHIMDEARQLEMHDLLCAIRLYETPALPQAIRERLFPRLQTVAEALVARDPAAWRGYGLPPLSVVSAPRSAFAPLFQEQLDANLDFVIDQLDAAGSWRPNWTWGAPSEAWAQAEREWSGVITLNNLVLLRAFGRLE